MRRVLALLCTLTLANLTLAQVGWACIGGNEASAAPAPAAEHAHHGGAATDEAASEVPAGQESMSHCLTMAHCVAAPAIAAERAGSARPELSARMPVTSDLVPPSAPTAPELPPPRA
jgi:hypothetical protein